MDAEANEDFEVNVGDGDFTTMEKLSPQDKEKKTRKRGPKFLSKEGGDEVEGQDDQEVSSE